MAATKPDHPAVRTADGSLSYRQLTSHVDAAVWALSEAGIGPGDRVALRIRAGLDFPAVLWAIFRLRATAVLLNDRDSAEPVVQRCRETGCKLIISSDEVDAPIPVLEPTALTYSRSTTSGMNALDLDSAATIIFTSGSSALPKAVVHSLGNHWYSAEGSQHVIPVSHNTRWALMIPVNHVGGLSILFRCFRFGGTVEVIDKVDREPARLISRNVTHASVVPTQVRDWLTSPDRQLLAQLDTILVGGAAASAGMISRTVDAGWRVRTTYGSTEMASQIATAEPFETSRDLGYVGRVLPHREVEVRDGEVFVRGRTRFLGYWDNRRIKTAFDEEGWFATGDLGRLEEDRLFVTGRKDNMFVSGGENVYPEEIEEAILNTGIVDAAIVVPVQHERFGSRPIAFVRPLCSLETLRDELQETLPAYKLPDDVRLLPVDMDGSKLNRRELMRLVAASGGAPPTPDPGPRTSDFGVDSVNNPNSVG